MNENNFDQIAKELYPERMVFVAKIPVGEWEDQNKRDRDNYLRGLKECMPLIEHIRELAGMHKEFLDAKTKEAFEAYMIKTKRLKATTTSILAAFPAPGKPEDEPKEPKTTAILRRVYETISRHRDKVEPPGSAELSLLLYDIKQVLDGHNEQSPGVDGA